MPFDQPTRNRLARFVADARTLLTAEFTRQLQHEYGLDPTSGAVTPLERLTHLDDTRRESARILRATLDHYLAGSSARGVKAQQEALDRIVREQAFTVLNRLCALRMAEARGLLIESVARGYQSKGFQLYARLAGPALGETGDAYRCYLFSLCDEFAVDLAVLFDRFSPQGRLFPGTTTLLQLLDLLNHPDLDSLWAEDETIGWIYQYFNSREERQAMRDPKKGGSQAPRNSRELAVRNQFFTPRYVVEFLTDNTLGRIWYEMTKGETGLKESCRYLVRRPNEIFLGEGETAPAPTQPAEDLSQEDLLKQPVYIPHRPLKDPREIKMLDPACGSMHFGLYAFDLFERIYEEAWEMQVSGQWSVTSEQSSDSRNQPTRATKLDTDHRLLITDYPTKEELLLDLPRLILEHNIHGIDIDPRAVQIAALSLWLRAQRSWQAQGVKAQDRPPIRRSHIVCAEPMPGETEMLAEFAATLQPPVLGQLVKVIFEKMKLAGEAGSLLKIEEELAGAVAEAKRQWLAGGKPEQGRLFPDDTPRQMGLELDLSGITDEAFWDRAEALVLKALKEYAEQAENGDSYQRRLFAGDAAQGFAFIDLCRRRYEVVLMNPPFGLGLKSNFNWLKERFPDGYVDIYAAFVARSIQLSTVRSGAISSRSFLVSKKLERLRRNGILTKLEVLLDLGWAVMDDATVQSAAYVLNIEDKSLSKEFLAFDRKSTPTQSDGLVKVLSRSEERGTYIADRELLKEINQARILYSLPRKILHLLTARNNLGDNVLIAKQGMKTFNDFRFLRLRFEIAPLNIGPNLEWEPLSKGGPYAMFYSDLPILVRWQGHGAQVAEENRRVNGQTAQARQASAYYRRLGATYSRRSSKDFGVRVLPKNFIIGEKGPAVFPLDGYTPELVIGLLNSRFINTLVHLQANAKQYDTGILEKLPWQDTERSNIEKIEQLTRMAIEIFRAQERFVETSALFTCCFTPGRGASLSEVTENARAKSIEDQAILLDCIAGINSTVDAIYGFDSEDLLTRLAFSEDASGEGIEENEDEEAESDTKFSITSQGITAATASYLIGACFGRWDVCLALYKRLLPELPDPFAPLPVCPPGMLQNAQGLPATPADVPADYPLRISWPGILVDDEDHPEDIVRRVREALQVIWPANHDAIEGEACEILGVRTLRDYFRKPAAFFADHLKRYSKSRRQAPVYWPLSTTSGSYTLWLYYHRLTGQTLYTCVNDFVDPKLKTVSEAASVLRQKSNRTRTEEKELEQLGDLALELQDFRAELLRIAAFWQPNLNDGVQITAAPLWRLFQHRGWQKRLKETWDKLAAGDYDWAHLAHTIWPDRVAAKCQTDKSLAIAHNLEHLYVEPPAAAKKKARGRAKALAAEQEEMFDDE
ncbi:MAG: BREX-1 system adenine-specific DNA-methyltransferase PglX [Chloroflexi bacterium]|nr:MAG: BREX-1 system adenine-specific DNA-methyltransferase PglX [Chloroflexota bacterium]